MISVLRKSYGQTIGMLADNVFDEGKISEEIREEIVTISRRFIHSPNAEFNDVHQSLEKLMQGRITKEERDAIRDIHRYLKDLEEQIEWNISKNTHEFHTLFVNQTKKVETIINQYFLSPTEDDHLIDQLEKRYTPMVDFERIVLNYVFDGVYVSDSKLASFNIELEAFFDQFTDVIRVIAPSPNAEELQRIKDNMENSHIFHLLKTGQVGIK